MITYPMTTLLESGLSYDNFGLDSSFSDISHFMGHLIQKPSL